MPPNQQNIPNNTKKPEDELAANVIREKVARIYSEEPNAQKELAESQASPHRSKHQEFMYNLSTSGKDLATIQTEWHNYYQSLPSHERHQVWHEFYASQASVTGAAPVNEAQQLAAHKQEARTTTTHKKQKLRDARNPEEITAAIRNKVTAGGKLEAKHHIQSLLFGLSMGAVVLLVFLFSFFNEVIIAPFIQPARTSAATPIILSSDAAPATAQPEVIIPKINVEIPTDFSVTSTDESQIETALDSGVVHYPTTVHPGEIGNTAFFGHSSNNIFNKGKYKFAFVLLHTLEKGDTFYLTYNHKSYVYKVISKTVVQPNNVSVLDPVPGHAATATLITCDPPGTSINRLIIVGEQVSPDPLANATAATPAAKLTNTPSAALPGNGQTLQGRIIQSSLGKIAVVAILVGGIVFVARRAIRKMSN